MKKFTSLMLMLLFAVTTWGQVVEEQMYRLKESDRNLYLTIVRYNGDGTNNARGGVPFLAKETANEDQVWYFESTGTDGQYYVKSKSGYYLVHGGWNVDAYDTNTTIPSGYSKGIVQLVENGDGIYKLKNVNAGKWYKSGASSTGETEPYPYCDADEASACNWALEIVNESEFTSTPIEVTYNFTYNGEATGITQTATAVEGGEFPAITVTLPFGVTASVPTDVVSAENATQDIEVEVSLPFEPATSYDDANMKWYYLIFDSSNKFYLHHDADQGYIDLGSKAVDLNNKNAYTWAFIGDPFNGYKIVNRATGDGYILSSSTTMAGTTGSDTWPIMTQEPVDEGNNEYWIATSSTHITNGFFLAQKGYANNRMNNRGKLAYWTGGAGSGSTFYVEERPMGAVADLEELITVANTKLTEINANIGTQIGEYAQETADALSTAITTAEGIGEAATDADVTELLTAINAVKKILPTAGKYYQFHNSLTAFAETKAVYANGDAPGWKTLNNDDKTFYWEAVATANGIALKNASNGKYLIGNANESGAWSLADDATGAEMDVEIFSTTENEKGYEYGIIVTGWQMHANNHGGGTGTGSNIVSWNTDNANSASSWFIVEAELPSFYNVTYSYKYNGEEVYTETIAVIPDAEYPDPAYVAPYGVTLGSKPDGTVTGTTTADITVEITEELPFVTAESADAITTWYYIQMHTNEPGYIGDIADDNTINVASGKGSDVASENFVWGFVGNVFDGITVVNKGTNKQLTSTGSGNVTLTDAGTALFVANTSETSANATNGFCLRKSDSQNYLNANYSAGKLSHWSSTDAGSTFFLSEYKESTVNVTSAGWATMYLGYATYVPEGVNVYAVTGVEYGYVTKEQITGTIPANTGVLLETAGEFTFKKAANYTAALSGNLLYGSVENSYVEGAAYVLANGENGVGLYMAELNKDADGNDGDSHFLNNAGKAYMVLPEQQSTATFYGFEWSGTTGIENIEDAVEENATEAIYDITGRQIKAITVPGIYIINGKKTFVK
ncbi:MAG: hypothetical protein IJZ22_02130 [Bacteroidaceae bacterium]|nr:hypothetical protein [Bacteroidaceae bacterium]